MGGRSRTGPVIRRWLAGSAGAFPPGPIFGYLLFIRLDSMHDPGGALIGFLCLFGFVLAERLGAYTENPFVDGIFGLPMNRICATISSNLLTANHPLATPPQNQSALIWT